MKRSTKHMVFRFGLLLVIVVVTAIAIAQTQRGLETASKPEGQTNENSSPPEQVHEFQPIPVNDQATSVDPESDGQDQMVAQLPEPAFADDQWADSRLSLEPTIGDVGGPDVGYQPVTDDDYSSQEIYESDQYSSPLVTQVAAVSAQENQDLPALLAPSDAPRDVDVDYTNLNNRYSPVDSRTPEPDADPANEYVEYVDDQSFAGSEPLANSEQTYETVTGSELPDPTTTRQNFLRNGLRDGSPEPFPPDSAELDPPSETVRVTSDSPVAATYDSQSEPFEDPSSVADFGTQQPEFDSAQPEISEGATGKPGPSELEGSQAASLIVEKSAPQEIRVGSSAKFTITIKNQGRVPANEVLIRDEIPVGTRLIGTVPQADRMTDGSLVWQMGTIKPGGEVTATMEVMPVTEGQVGSVATVAFQASASARSVVTQPRLAVQQTGPRQVLVGEDVVFNIQLTNPGTGTATNVVIQEDVPDGLTHAAGSELEYQVGTLKPNESKYLELTLKAAKPGIVENVLAVRADSNLSVIDSAQVEIVAPELQIVLDGPGRRYLRRGATFHISVTNPGTAGATDVELVAYLPKGLKFVNTTNAGYYDDDTHSVHWSLVELPAKQMGNINLDLLPIEMGEHRIRVEGKAAMDLNDSVEKQLRVEGLAALLFSVADVADPIEVGGQTTYEIRVVNQGSKTATNIRIVATVPPGMRAIDANGPTRVLMEPQRVVFEPLPQLAPQADSTFKVHVQGENAGDKRFRVQLTSDNTQEPVTKEESTKVYADE